LKPVLGRSFSFLRTIKPDSLNIFQNQRTAANSGSLGAGCRRRENNPKSKKPLKKLKELTNFHETPAKNQFQNQFFVTEVDIYTRDDNGAA
jgi:hypothetical protein